MDISQGNKTTTLCGNRAAFGTPTGWFALVGCKRCAKAALRDGYTTIHDIDGADVDLADVLIDAH